MAKHEKHLLIFIISLLLVMITWIMIGWFVTGYSPILLLRNFFHPLISIRLIFFLLPGLAGFRYEMTIISKGIQLFEKDNEPFPITDTHVLASGIGMYITFVLAGFLFGTDEAGILEGMYNILLGCLGFSIIFGFMLLGAFIARKRRERS